MKTTRRTFLGGIAAVSVPVSATVAQTIHETQEEKCIRLTKELIAEFSRIPFHGKCLAGPYVDLKNGADIDWLRYVADHDGKISLLAIIDLRGSTQAREKMS